MAASQSLASGFEECPPILTSPRNVFYPTRNLKALARPSRNVARKAFWLGHNALNLARKTTELRPRGFLGLPVSEIALRAGQKALRARPDHVARKAFSVARKPKSLAAGVSEACVQGKWLCAQTDHRGRTRPGLADWHIPGVRHGLRRVR